jgi:hypothetical protein
MLQFRLLTVPETAGFASLFAFLSVCGKRARPVFQALQFLGAGESLTESCHSAH